MTTYSFEIVTGHLIADIGDMKVLIDTGSPASVGSGVLEIAGKEHSLQDEFSGVNIQGLAEMVGCPLDALVGADILRQYDVLLDGRAKSITFGNGDIEFVGRELPSTFFMGIPVVDVEMNGKSVSAYIDTGAKLSYLDEEYLAGLEAIGEEEDFYPGAGTFTTSVYEVPSQAADSHFTLSCGVLPEMLQMLLAMGGADGILGSEFLSYFNVFIAEGEGPVSVAPTDTDATLPRRRNMSRNETQEVGKDSRLRKEKEKFGEINWLARILDEAGRKKWCTKPYCTTCGSMEFRNAVFGAAARRAGIKVAGTKDRFFPESLSGEQLQTCNRLIAEALKEIQKPSEASLNIDEGIRTLLILLDYNSHLVGTLLDSSPGVELKGSWAGEILVEWGLPVEGYVEGSLLENRGGEDV